MGIDYFSVASCEVLASMPMFARYRAKVEHSIVFVKIVIQCFERQQFCQLRKLQSFDSGSVRIKGAKTLYLSVWDNILFMLL